MTMCFVTHNKPIMERFFNLVLYNLTLRLALIQVSFFCRKNFHDAITYMLARGAEPFPVWNNHERRSQAGSMVTAITGITQEYLYKQKLDIRYNCHSETKLKLCLGDVPVRDDWEGHSVCRGHRWVHHLMRR